MTDSKTIKLGHSRHIISISEPNCSTEWIKTITLMTHIITSPTIINKRKTTTPTAVPTIHVLGEVPFTIIPSVVPAFVVVAVVVVRAAREHS